MQIMQMWIATAYDSDDGFALGETAQAAQNAYADRYGRPDYGFSVIRHRADYTMELARIGLAMGYDVARSIPLYRTREWIIVARLAEGAQEALECAANARRLRNDWTRSDGEFFIAPPPATPPRATTPLARKDRRMAALRDGTTAIDGVAPSARQRQSAVENPWNWKDEMAWAHARGDIALTADEIGYVRAYYAAHSVPTAIVNQVYR